mmetsp:Transcript_23786/g.61789  ORF Transcript_23786/g.61789 Transcript_23786/m.61789 type:complete len:391 (+) Transcript_23786:94-1266(+)
MQVSALSNYSTKFKFFVASRSPALSSNTKLHYAEWSMLFIHVTLGHPSSAPPVRSESEIPEELLIHTQADKPGYAAAAADVLMLQPRYQGCLKSAPCNMPTPPHCHPCPARAMVTLLGGGQPAGELVVVLALVLAVHHHLLVEVLADLLDLLILLGAHSLAGLELGQLVGALGGVLGGAGDLDTAGSLGVGVELEHDAQVLQGVLLQGCMLGGGSLLWPDHALDLIRVDQAGEVAVGHDGAGQLVALLHLALLGLGAEDGVQAVKGRLGPDAEAAHVATRGQLQQVQAVDGGDLHTGQVAEGLGDAAVLTEDHQGALAQGVAAVPHLTLAAADGLGVLALLGVSVCANLLQHLNGLAGLRQALSSVVQDQGNLWHLLNPVSSCHHQSGDC